MEYNPFNAGGVGGTPQDIAVQVQSDLAKSEMALIGLVCRDILRPDHRASHGMQEFLHSLSVIQKLDLLDALCKAVNPDKSDTDLERSRKIVKKRLRRFAEIRNKLSHCTRAEIQDDVVVVYEDRIGADGNITQLELAELEEYVGPKWLDIIDEMKYLFSTLSLSVS